MQFHVLSFEGPDPYARAGGLATRVAGLSKTLAQLGFETHLWFIGDPSEPGHERRGELHLHRWAQWISRRHPGGVYEGEFGTAFVIGRNPSGEHPLARRLAPLPDGLTALLPDEPTGMAPWWLPGECAAVGVRGIRRYLASAVARTA